MSMLLIGSNGYIGSALYNHLVPTHSIQGIDTRQRGNPGNVPHLFIDYNDLSSGLIACHDTIVILAAHSSVGSAVSDPHRAFYNNVVAFERLLHLLHPEQRLIYASSSSIYSGFTAQAASEEMSHGNMYDASKAMNDMLAAVSGKQTYGLRFGTVCGVSPNMRNDLMINRMVTTAMNDGYVQIANPIVHRPILGMNDLVKAIATIVDGDGEPGIYNLCSFNDQVAHIGAVVADICDVPLVLGEPSDTYDFEISSQKFMDAYSFQFEESCESITKSLVEAMRGSNSGTDDELHSVAALSGV